jgi:putative isomerase
MRRAKSFFIFSFYAGLAAAACGAQRDSHLAAGRDGAVARSAEYAKVQQRLARGWNTWDVHSVATQVLLPEGLAIHVGMKHNSSLNGDAFLGDALIGRLEKDAEVVTPGPHAWDGSYTSADFAWKGHKWRVESAHDGDDLVMLVTRWSRTSGIACRPPLCSA